MRRGNGLLSGGRGLELSGWRRRARLELHVMLSLLTCLVAVLLLCERLSLRLDLQWGMASLI